MYMHLGNVPTIYVGYSDPYEFGVTYNVYGRDVAVSIETKPEEWGQYTYGPGPEIPMKLTWEMRLQRFNTWTREWNTIGTRTGYVATNSPSNRTFTDIRETLDPLRLVVEFTFNEKYTTGDWENRRTLYSPNFFIKP